ncbi:unnamed protein product [Adineta ricciae]|uniref:B box-type domain-containing protein n=1 Tax=Adineta ricciae TaxID=249248 RepID=A0A816C6V4_ADIRI|nr:unnamed protein product [Adineta ricciae]
MLISGPILCFECETVTASYWCAKCEKNFCSKCNETLHTSRTGRTHQRVPIADKPSEVALCGLHPDEKLKYWCETCETVICNDCQKFMHITHTVSLTNDTTAKLQEKIESSLQIHESFLNDQLNQANKLKIDIERVSQLHKLKIIETMAALREIIEQHEKSMLEHILAVEVSQTKEVEDYSTRLQEEVENLKKEIAKFTLIIKTKNQTKLFQSKQDFDEYTKLILLRRKELKSPTGALHHIEGLEQLQTLIEKILTTVRYVEIPKSKKSQLEQRIANTRASSLNLCHFRITDQDMQIVARALQNSNARTQLWLQENKIGDEGMQHLATALQNNTTLRVLNLRQNRISEKGAQHLADAVRTNKTLTNLYLHQNKICAEAAKHLANALQNNTTLTKLYLHDNYICDQGAQYLAETIQSNTTLTKIWLQGNEITDVGTQYLADALQKNTTLTCLGLQRNEISNKGAEHLANALRNNTTLKQLYLRGNQIGDIGTQHLANALQNSSALICLGIQENQISSTGAQHLGNVLRNNKILTGLGLEENQIGDKGVQYLSNALRNNTAIHRLLFERNIYVSHMI